MSRALKMDSKNHHPWWLSGLSCSIAIIVNLDLLNIRCRRTSRYYQCLLRLSIEEENTPVGTRAFVATG